MPTPRPGARAPSAARPGPSRSSAHGAPARPAGHPYGPGGATPPTPGTPAGLTARRRGPAPRRARPGPGGRAPQPRPLPAGPSAWWRGPVRAGSSCGSGGLGAAPPAAGRPRGPCDRVAGPALAGQPWGWVAAAPASAGRSCGSGGRVAPPRPSPGDPGGLAVRPHPLPVASAARPRPRCRAACRSAAGARRAFRRPGPGRGGARGWVCPAGKLAPGGSGLAGAVDVRQGTAVYAGCPPARRIGVPGTPRGSRESDAMQTKPAPPGEGRSTWITAAQQEAAQPRHRYPPETPPAPASAGSCSTRPTRSAAAASGG